MTRFNGFTDTETFTQLPDSIFFRLFGEINDMAELKVTLYALWRVARMEGPFRALRLDDFEANALGLDAAGIAQGLEKAILRGSLLQTQVEAKQVFLLNSPRGRAIRHAIESGQWSAELPFSALPVERPNIFRLYEENIGPLTPMIADMLKDAEEMYSDAWIAEALEIAVKNNIRNWKYVEAILRRWKEKGKHEREDRKDAGKDFERYSEGEFAEYLKRG